TRQEARTTSYGAGLFVVSGLAGGSLGGHLLDHPAAVTVVDPARVLGRALWLTVTPHVVSETEPGDEHDDYQSREGDDHFDAILQPDAHRSISLAVCIAHNVAVRTRESRFSIVNVAARISLSHSRSWPARPISVSISSASRSASRTNRSVVVSVIGVSLSWYRRCSQRTGILPGTVVW